MDDLKSEPGEIALCSRAELTKNRRIARWVEEWRDEVVVFDHSPHPLVISGMCPHFGGEVDFVPATNRFRCRWHHWEFDARDGHCLTYPIKGCVRFYESTWRGDTLA